MPTQVQFRRGTTTQNESFTGAVGELSVDTTLDTVRVHDGSTAGGIRLAKYSEIQSGDITAAAELLNQMYADAQSQNNSSRFADIDSYTPIMNGLLDQALTLAILLALDVLY